MDIDLSQFDKIDRFQTVKNKTSITSWYPAGKG
jgi:hypothetical protein